MASQTQQRADVLDALETTFDHGIPAPIERLRQAHWDGILIATDGTTQADGAVRVGLALAQRDGQAAEQLSVIEPAPVFDPMGMPDMEPLVQFAREDREEHLQQQRARTCPAAPSWPVTIEVGDRVTTIVKAAIRGGPRLIVLGVGEHGAAARLFLRETALRVIRQASVPVLAVSTHAWGVPRRALAALDFTASSERAASAALRLLGDEGILYLAHVTPRIPIPHGDAGTWEDFTSHGARGKLAALERRLAAPAGVRIEHVSMHGDPAQELLQFAEEFNVDVIAAGSHGRSAFGRLALGSVSTTLVRSAGCWVLVAPASDTAPSSPG